MKMHAFVLVSLCAAALLSGCKSYYEISTNIPNDIKVEDGEKPLAVVYVDNVSYQLFDCIPFCSGDTPDVLPEEERFGHLGGIKYFTDRATIDNNLKTVRAAAKRLGSNRISNLYSITDDSGLWSLYLFNRHTVRTSCLILESPKE